MKVYIVWMTSVFFYRLNVKYYELNYVYFHIL